MLIDTSVSTRSVAVADPIATTVCNPVASAVTSPGKVNTGGVVSTTVTVCTPVDAFPSSSVAVHVTTVEPRG